MRKTSISEIAVQEVNIPLSECLDELTRELSVRRRIYDRWVAECRLSWTEARDQFTRLAGAVKYLQQQVEIEAANIEQQEAFNEAAATMPDRVAEA